MAQFIVVTRLLLLLRLPMKRDDSDNIVEEVKHREK